VYLLLKAEQLLARLNNQEPQQLAGKWMPEFASFMIEGLPGLPYEHDISCIGSVESNMKLRKQQAQALLAPNEYLMTFSTFPLLGCPEFTWPPAYTTPDRGITCSMFFPDQAIFSGHPKYATSILNNRKRRQTKTCTNIPIFMDINTPRPFIEDLSVYYEGNLGVNQNKLFDHIYLEGIGASCR
jgi:glutamate--cysteine ligase catalytic subunit